MKALAFALAACFSLVIVLPVIGFATGVISLPFRAATRGLETANGIIDQTLTADNAIYNYEWFKQQVQDIKAIQLKIEIAERAVLSFEEAAGPRNVMTFEDKTEDSRLRSVAQGLRSQYETLIADYNARASMANRAIFNDGLIPNVLEAAASFIQ